MDKPIPLTPDQIRISEELSAFAGRLFLTNSVPVHVGVRILATMVTWMAVRSGMTSTDYADLMREMHETIKKQGAN